ncbi:hypothetical protein K456DRAFT_1483705 [Colletotrichum gloeosporioides 23]|nr:hypothetical protein K456DRAFT_1483705 [Colletotrichum gloeosporioides 23]
MNCVNRSPKHRVHAGFSTALEAAASLLWAVLTRLEDLLLRLLEDHLDGRCHLDDPDPEGAAWELDALSSGVLGEVVVSAISTNRTRPRRRRDSGLGGTSWKTIVVSCGSFEPTGHRLRGSMDLPTASTSGNHASCKSSPSMTTTSSSYISLTVKTW